MPCDLSVIVPLFNEADNVGPLVSRIRDALETQSRTWEVLLVDDCSSDGTWLRIADAQKCERRLKAVRHHRNMGQSAALWTGFRNSTSALIATLDGDLQNDPIDLPKMLGALESCDMVCGVRARRADNWLRRVSSRIARTARRLFLRVDFADTGCNLRVFRRVILQTLPAFNGIHRFMPVFAQKGGARVIEMPVCHHPRAAGVSKYGVWNRLGRGICDLIMVSLYLRRQLVLLPEANKPERATPPASKELSTKQ